MLAVCFALTASACGDGGAVITDGTKTEGAADGKKAETGTTRLVSVENVEKYITTVKSLSVFSACIIYSHQIPFFCRIRYRFCLIFQILIDLRLYIIVSDRIHRIVLSQSFIFSDRNIFLYILNRNKTRSSCLCFLPVRDTAISVM